MLNIVIRETRWTRRVWCYIGYSDAAILGCAWFVEFIANGSVKKGLYYNVQEG